MMWVAFCSNSTLTLADGIHLAKTRRDSKEVLELLSGIGLGEESSPGTSEHEHDAEEAEVGKDEHLWGAGASHSSKPSSKKGPRSKRDKGGASHSQQKKGANPGDESHNRQASKQAPHACQK